MRNMTTRKTIRTTLLALALSVVVAGTALATDPNGFASQLLAQGTTAGSVNFKLHSGGDPKGKIEFVTKGAIIVRTAQNTISPGGSSGWHSHPGIVLVTVKTGTVTFYSRDCSFNVYPTGASFVEREGDGPGLARNEGGVDAIVVATFIAFPGTTVFRVGEGNPGCSVS
jgi:quercetin dioxygenase-like cupin family protein